MAQIGLASLHGPVTLAAAVLPATQTPGDAFAHHCSPGLVRFAVFDAMGSDALSRAVVGHVVDRYLVAARSEASLGQTVADLDAAVAARFQGESYCTGVLAELDTATGHLRWMNAGHPVPLLLGDAAAPVWLGAEPALPLGLGFMAKQPGGGVLGTHELAVGGAIVLYSDGMTEARAPDGRYLGATAFAATVVENLGARRVDDGVSRIMATVDRFQAGQVRDDATIFVARWHDRTLPTPPDTGSHS